MKGGGCASDPSINARTYPRALPPAVFEQQARPIMEAAGVIPSPIPDLGHCCFIALNVTVFDDDSHELMCKTRRDMTSFIHSEFDDTKVPWSNLPFKSSKEELIHQHHNCNVRVGEEHHGDDNTVHIFAAMHNTKFLALKVHEESHQAYGEDKLAGPRYFLIFDSTIKHWSATVKGCFTHRANVIYFSNPYEEYGFLDSFSVVPDTCRIRYQSKRDFLGLFSTVEQLYSFMMAELFNDWARADEILKSKSPFDAVKLAKTIRIFDINGVTGEVSTARHAFDTEDWYKSAPSIMAAALTAKFHGNEELTSKLLATMPRPLAKTSQFDLHWGIGLSPTEAVLGMKWRGTNWMGDALMTLRGKLLHARAAAPCTGNYTTLGSEAPSDAEVVTATLQAVNPYDPCPRPVAGQTYDDGDLHCNAQLFMPQSNEQQAALFGNDVMGSILPTERMGAPLAHVKELLKANGVSFAGEKRSRNAIDAVAPCVTCLQCRDDDCTVCGTCCACCLCLPRKQFVEKHTYLQKQCAKAEVVVSEPMALDKPVVGSAAIAGADAEVVTQYATCKHGFVLVQGELDDTLQPQCTMPPCVRSASRPFEAMAKAAAGIQQPVVSAEVLDEAEESPDPHDGYTCDDCGSEFVTVDNLLSHNCPASGNTSVHPPADEEDVPLCTYQVVYGQLADGAPTCNVGVRPIAVDGVLVSGHTDTSIPHYSESADGIKHNPDHVVCERCGKFFDLETLLGHSCRLSTIDVKHRLPASGINSPPVSLPLVNNEVAFVHSKPPSRKQKVKLEVDAECTSLTPEPGTVSKACYACGVTVDLASSVSCKEGQDVFCNAGCRDYVKVDPSCIVLTDENREQANEVARVLEARLRQVQAAVVSDEDEPVYPERRHDNLFNADPPGFLGNITDAKDRHYFSDGILHMVELFAGVGAFGTGWRRLGNTVIGVCEWNESLKELLLERNPGTVFGTDFNKVNFHAWRSLFDQSSQRVHCTAGGPECTPFSGVGKEKGVNDPRASQITGMADVSKILGSCVCCIENVPNIEDHDFTAVIQYFRSKDYHMVVNQYVEHVKNGGSTIRKRIFPTFEVGQMASIMPPVGMLNTKLPIFKRIDGSGFDVGTARDYGDVILGDVNPSAISKYLMPFEEVPSWLQVYGDFQYDGLAENADPEDCQRIGCLWFGEHTSRPAFEDLAEGQRVKMDFDEMECEWVIFTIHPLTQRLKVFKDDRKSPQYRECGRRRQFLTTKNVREIVPHRIPVYSIHFPCLTIRKFRVPPAFNGPLIADDRGRGTMVRRMSGEELWRLTQLPVADKRLLLEGSVDTNSCVEELELGSLAGNSIPASMVQPELCSIDQRIRQFSALVDSSPDYFQWIHVAAPAVDMPVTIDFLVIIRSLEGSSVKSGEECALWCSTLEALPGRVLTITDSRDSAVSWGESVATRIVGGCHVGLLAAEYSHSKVTIRIVVVPTSEADLALEYNDFEADWLKIQESEGSKAWDIVSVAYARMTSHGSQPTDAAPWIEAADGEDQV